MVTIGNHKQCKYYLFGHYRTQKTQTGRTLICKMSNATWYPCMTYSKSRMRCLDSRVKIYRLAASLWQGLCSLVKAHRSIRTRETTFLGVITARFFAPDPCQRPKSQIGLRLASSDPNKEPSQRAGQSGSLHAASSARRWHCRRADRHFAKRAA